MFEKIARFSVKFRWLIIIAWIAAVPVLTSSLPKISDVTKNDNSQFLPKNSPTQKAADLAAQFQAKDTAGGALLVASRADGPLTAADSTAIDRVIAQVKTLKSITNVQDRGLSKDGQAHQFFVGINGDAFGPGAATVIDNIRSKLVGLPSGAQLNLTGQLPQSVDGEKSNNSGRNKTEIYNIIFIIVLLLLVFRAVLAPLVTLLPAALSLIIAQPIIAESTKLGVQVSFITEILLIVLLLGAGTDYGLFLVFRTREELKKGSAPKEAVVKALARVGESITFSAATVAAALLCLLLASFGIYKGLGPALAIGLGVMLLAALTFLPALLSILGRAVFWPSKTIKTPLKIGLWGRVADKVIKRPLVMLAAGVVVFASLSLGIIGYKTAGFTSSAAPASSDSAIGQAVLDKHFPGASNNPQEYLLVFNKPVWQNLAAVAKAGQLLKDSGEYSAVSSMFNANGFEFSVPQIEALHNSGDKNNPSLTAINQFVSPDGKTVIFYVVSKAGSSGSTAALNATPKERQILGYVASQVGAVDSQIYGQDAAAYDIGHIANSDLKKIIPVVLVIIALLLAIMLRSLVAPWYLIATVGFSYLAALGFAMIVFVHISGGDGLNFILPFMMFIFSMALGEDYNILVMSRIREEAHGNVPLKQAVTKAIGITGSTVTSAGIILAGTFTVFGLVGGNEQLREIGFSIAFGILLDTFFVRTLLVPSIVALLGRWNWWPSKLATTRAK